MYKKFFDNIYKKYNSVSVKKEDSTVLNFFNNQQFSKTKINYLEVGSGLCRFPLLLRDRFKNFNFNCLEKNIDLVNVGISNGLNVVCGDIIKTDFSDQEFDIVHCSHVIEHIAYPQIIKALDELIRITKVGGYIIIRSPLMSHNFFISIDHIRPYPPRCIFDYYSNPQQQVMGMASIRVIREKFRREAFEPFPYASSRLAKGLNIIMKLSWTYLRFPFARPSGYVLILQKQ
jgi:ubiquinone/menaquinone biosynthesis C-methylase UbiE